jgi:hypothetical protein
VLALWSYSSRQVRMSAGVVVTLFLALALPGSSQSLGRWMEPGNESTHSESRVAPRIAPTSLFDTITAQEDKP